MPQALNPAEHPHNFCEHTGYDLVFDDAFDGLYLNIDHWLPHDLPHWNGPFDTQAPCPKDFVVSYVRGYRRSEA